MRNTENLAYRSANMVKTIATPEFAQALEAARERCQAAERQTRELRYPENPNTGNLIAAMVEMLRGKNRVR